MKMTRRIATFVTAALLLFGGATLATTASARDSFAVSIGVPGVAFGYSNYGYGYGYAAPYSYYAPAPAYYGPPVVAYYQPYGYYHHYRPYGYYRHW
jgi:hypothetical protein